MTPRQRAEMERLKGRVRILEQRNRELVAEAGGGREGQPRRGQPRPLSKESIDRLIWLTNTIEETREREGGKRFVTVRVSGSDARLFRRLVERLVAPPV